MPDSSKSLRAPDTTASPAVSILAGQALSSSSRLRLFDRVAHGIALASGVFILALLIIMAYEVLKLSVPSIRHSGWRFFVSAKWDPANNDFGLLPFVYGTIVSSVIALLIATPFGIGTALFLTELAPRKLRGPVGFVVDMLAAIPSVVYGLWGIFVLAPFMAAHLGPFLEHYLGWLPFFKGPAYGVGMLTAGLILSIMVVPYIVAISREVLLTVPQELKAASLALGATYWETLWKIVLPQARIGIGGGIVLALGRALGETMAVTMVIGNQPAVHLSVLQPGYSMAAVIANEFTEASSALYLSALAEVGLALFLISVIINLAARYLLWRLRSAAAR
jgi:phosphate transport system permease protein